MSIAELFADAAAADAPSPIALQTQIAELQVLRTAAGVVTGAGRVTVRVQDQTLPCDWLRGFDDHVRDGLVKPGVQVVVLMLGARPVILDLVVKGATPVAGS